MLRNLGHNKIKLLGFKKEEIMKKGSYEQPRITIYEVETTAILAGSGETNKVPSNPKSFSLENDELTSGDNDDVWE